MENYVITIVRTCAKDFEVKAKSLKEAQEIAEQEAMNYDWSTSQADYSVE